MSCKQWNDEWIAQLYDELEPEREREMRAHLERCPACRRSIDVLAESRSLLRDATPEVPPSPRLIVLQPQRRWAWHPVWAWAGGAACASIVFAFGVLVGGRAASGPEVPGGGPGALTAAASPAAVESLGDRVKGIERRLAGVEGRGAEALDGAEVLDALQAFEARVTAVEGRSYGPVGKPDGQLLTRVQLRDALGELEQRLSRKRESDLRYVVESITASEIRTGAWMDQTQEALTYLALRQDPRIGER